MKNFLFLEIASLVGCSIIVVGRSFKVDVINVILIAGILQAIFAIYKSVKSKDEKL